MYQWYWTKPENNSTILLKIKGFMTVIRKSSLKTCFTRLLFPNADIQEETVFTTWLLWVTFLSKVTPKSLTDWVCASSLPKSDRWNCGSLSAYFRIRLIWSFPGLLTNSYQNTSCKIFIHNRNSTLAIMYTKQNVQFGFIDITIRWTGQVKRNIAS